MAGLEILAIKIKQERKVGLRILAIKIKMGLKARKMGPETRIAMQTMRQVVIHLHQEVEGKCRIARSLESICTPGTTFCYP